MGDLQQHKKSISPVSLPTSSPRTTDIQTRDVHTHVHHHGSQETAPNGRVSAHTASQARARTTHNKLDEQSQGPRVGGATYPSNHPPRLGATPEDSAKRKRAGSNDTLPTSSKRQHTDNVGRSLSNTKSPQPGAGARQGPGFFNGAHNMVFNQPKMTEIRTQNIMYGQATGVLEWLVAYTMRGAEFDSSERDPPPRCHPGTRKSIIDRAQGWIQDDEREKNLWWLHGPAGVGKSAIIQTLAEHQSNTGRLGAAIFFSRPHGRNNPQQVFPTLAYQFAVRDRAYRSYLGDLMAIDPNCLRKSMSEQFRILIVEPFARLHIHEDSGIFVVALDGLDECAGDPGGQGRSNHVHTYGRHSDRAQCEVVRLISNFVLQHPSVHLLWVISSRPEPHLKAAFYNEQVRSSFWEEDMPVDSEEACRDVEKFLHTEFTRIQQDYPELIPTLTWPSNAQFLQIAKGASGLFAFASVIIRFIDDPWVSNPVAQLDCVLAALSRVINAGQENPLAPLDALYTEILSRISLGLLQTTKRLLGAFIFLERSRVGPTECGFRCICNLLDIKRDAAISALRSLHSVLRIPDAQDIADSRPRFYHASFQDYLEDNSRSQEYWVDQNNSGHELFWGSVRLMKALYYRSTPAQRKQDIFVGIQLSWPDGFDAQLFQSAREALRCILFGDISQFDVIVHYYTAYISLPDHEFRSILENLSIKEMVKGTFRDRALLRSLVLESIPSKTELERRRFLSGATIESLFLGKVANSATVSVDAIHQTVRIHLNEPPALERGPDEVASDQEVIDQMIRSVRAASAVDLLTLGTTKSERSVVCHIPGKTFFVTGI